MAKNTGLGKGLDALFSDKTVIEDIKKENEYGIYYYMNLYLHMIFNKISENSLGIIILTILIITMMYIF